ncbi:cation:proton antiporter [Flavihumibacter profundi]|uniref:cation:proton antiporter n=1 Tax=Flavihumibacter profundi TaxID=2716883 RepID=UPI001CC63901|nr:cation:proton antiporter [Flavihumibacter profundi]MBZ5857429.1 cation:proton antiporter [Flavihumibacter profundi]
MKKYMLTYSAVFVLFIGLMWWIISKGKKLVPHYSSLAQTETNVNTPIERVPSIISETPLEVFYQHMQQPLSRLLLQVIVILLVARIFGTLARRLRLQSVVGEMIAGIVLGPSLLGWVFPRFSAFLFFPDSLKSLQFLSQVGLVLFMFVIGMELDIAQVRNKAKDAVVISHASILFPYFLGTLLAYFLYEHFAYTGTSFLSFALFMGIAMSITAFPVLARILQERKLTQTPLGILTVTCAAADDVTAWCILAVVIAIVKAGGMLSALLAIGLAVLFVVFMLYPLKNWWSKTSAYLVKRKATSKTLIAGSFFVLLLSAWLAEVIGIHALFGAFLAGVIMPQEASIKKLLTDKVEDISVLLFLPIFFAFTGLRTHIGLLTEGNYWWICILIILVAVTGKFGGSTLAARIVGQSWKDALSVGVLMNTRGLMELVVLNIGFDLGILSPEIFAMMVIMALSTTLMTGPGLELINYYFSRPIVSPKEFVNRVPK